MRTGINRNKQKQQLKGFTRLTIFINSKLQQRKEEVLESLTLCSPLNRSFHSSNSLRFSINNIPRPRDILEESMNRGLAAILQNDQLSVDFNQFDEPSYIKERGSSNNDSPVYMTKDREENALNQKSMYFTYGDQLENNFNRK
jgi:hypothetical protein